MKLVIRIAGALALSVGCSNGNEADSKSTGDALTGAQPIDPVAPGVVLGVKEGVYKGDGSLAGAVYSNGVRTASVALNRPTDGALHRYASYRKTSRVFFALAMTFPPQCRCGAEPL